MANPCYLAKKNKRSKPVDIIKIKIKKDKEIGLSVERQFSLELRLMHVIKTESLKGNGGP